MDPVLLVALVVLAPFVLGPVHIYFTIRQSPLDYARSGDVELDGASPKDRDYIKATGSALEHAGFRAIGHFESTRPVASRVIMCSNEAGDAAVIICLRSPAATQRYLEFSTLFEDRSYISTYNAQTPAGTFAQIPGCTRLQFPSIEDPEKLYALHRAALSKSRGERRVLGLDPSAALERLAEGVERELDHQVTVGLMRLVGRQPAIYAPTVKGAISMTWKNAFPISQIRNGLMRWRMRREKDALQAFL